MTRAKLTPEQLKWTHGWLSCLATLVHNHGGSLMAKELYIVIGKPTLKECRQLGLSDYDLNGIRQLIKYLKGDQ